MGILDGKYVSLRPIEKSDIDVLNKWENDEEIYMYLGGGFQPISPDQQEKWLDNGKYCDVLLMEKFLGGGDL